MKHKLLVNLLLSVLVGTGTYGDNIRTNSNIPGKTALVVAQDKDLGSQLVLTNTRYIIRHDICLIRNSTITIPDNSILEFDGGSIRGECTLIGKKTVIKAEPENIFSSGVTLKGTWLSRVIYPEWFGAVGDGKTDDTKAIGKALQLDGIETCLFLDKVYVINMERQSDPTKPKAIFSPVKPNKIIGIGNATLKLGRGNCDIPNGTGFASILYISGKRHVEVKNLTFDYNYKENKHYQLGGESVIVEINGQQCAILFNNTERAVVRNCTFKEASGNNVISMWFNNSSLISEFICEDNYFVDIGNKSFYRGKEATFEAYHDMSVIGVHFNKEANKVGKARAIIRNNIANGAGGNAYDFCECHADEIEFTNNTIRDFAYCFMPLCARKDITANIRDNRFENCVAAIHFWNTPLDGIPAEHNTYGYKNLTIDNNHFTIDLKKWLECPLYNTLKFRDMNGYYYAGAGYYGAISQAGKGEKHIDSLSVINNHIKYVNVSDIPNSYFKTNYFATINFFSTPGQQEYDNIINKCIISDNTFVNVPNIVFRNNGYNKINEFIFSGNTLINAYCNPNFNNRIHGGGLLSDIVYGTVPENGFHGYKRKLKHVIIMGNTAVIDKKNMTSYEALAVWGRIRNDDLIRKSKVVVKNNTVVGEKFKHQASVENVEIVDME